MGVVLRTWKGVVKKLEEARRFHVAENETGQSSNVVGIDWGGEPLEIIFADGRTDDPPWRRRLRNSQKART